jgi:protein-S-isoprenylcysteine O-methyltransferase Ste14
MTNLNIRAARSLVTGAIAMAALLFLSAGTLDYWQAWVFIAVFVVASAATTMYLAIHDPKLLERRMKVGPGAEKEKTQKIIMVLAITGFVALLVVPALDHRFGWSRVPACLSIVADVLIALSFLFTFFVFRENSYGASTIQIADDQKVISTGPYALVRHPMYAGALIMLAATPVALDSWWGLAILPLIALVLIWRLLDEEKFLEANLTGYVEYKTKVRYRLIPYVW